MKTTSSKRKATTKKAIGRNYIQKPNKPLIPASRKPKKQVATGRGVNHKTNKKVHNHSNGQSII